eukprot:CAMPEP_0176505466 /NCGR_PEP_ID=MMETSP0200_2-20121128/16512_1 /TAXON_ID=947934 /ORGANISM="Chaetoceros sp., Strain GSL56" /LENGTH=212 /DNA_ID=CAMNT_0017905027 /DNA_START=12 /DNA_END=648 /DNA_ORIENTATION=+
MSGKAKGKPHKGPATSFKKNKKQKRMMFRKRKEVHTLQNDCAAWNVDGSSTCKILFSSWISFWESKTGTSRGICSFSSCNKTAEIGGHVWLKRKGPHIAPICSGCNYHKNVKRMQSSDGQHSFIKKGTTVVKVEFTEDMKNAVRRIAVNDKDMDDIDDESTNEESDESRDEESDESDISWVADSLLKALRAIDKEEWSQRRFQDDPVFIVEW